MTKMYRYTGEIKFAGAVEADSLVEACRIIDGVLNNAGEVVIHEEGDLDQLHISPTTITRGRVAVEN